MKVKMNIGLMNSRLKSHDLCMYHVTMLFETVPPLIPTRNRTRRVKGTLAVKRQEEMDEWQLYNL